MDKTLVNAFIYVVTLSHPNRLGRLSILGIGCFGSAQAVCTFRLYEHVHDT
jgi:hypothetical protein